VKGDRRETTSTQQDLSLVRNSRVRVPELAVGLLIVSACVLGALLWQRSVEKGATVLTASTDLKRGQLISEADLSAVVVSSDQPLRLLKVSAATQVVGMRALVDIPMGTPLSLTQLSVVEPVDARYALVGVTVTLAQAPLDLLAGDRVRMVSLNREVDGSRLVEVLVAVAEIWEISPQDDLDGRRSVSLRLPIDSASLALGHDELHLMKVGS
jgi:flagella basal body P-ring formation protein FlgA